MINPKVKPGPPSDIIWGASEIASVVGLNTGQVYYLYSRGYFGDAVWKFGQRKLAASRKALQQLHSAKSINKEEKMGSIIYDLRLPPDPKLGKDVKALLPDLSVFEMEQLKNMIAQFREWYRSNENYAAILFPMGAHHNANDRRDAFRMYEPLFQKILGER